MAPFIILIASLHEKEIAQLPDEADRTTFGESFSGEQLQYKNESFKASSALRTRCSDLGRVELRCRQLLCTAYRAPMHVVGLDRLASWALHLNMVAEHGKAH